MRSRKVHRRYVVVCVIFSMLGTWLVVSSTTDLDEGTIFPNPPSSTSIKVTALKGATAVSKPSTAEDLEVSEVIGAPLTPQSSEMSSLLEGVDQFTIVMLSYKSPLSLSATLQSLHAAGVTSHPNFKGVLVYFQVRSSGGEDDALVANILRPLGVQFTVLGDGRNLPVAQATTEAVRQAKTPLILYLECDRPVFPFGHKAYQTALTNAQLATIRARVTTQISLAARYVSKGDAHLFRLQLYSSEEALAPSSLSSLLPRNIYGSDPHRHCQNTPQYHRPPTSDDKSLALPHSGICIKDKRSIKASHGHEFYTAYCKHWSKLQLKKGEGDVEEGSVPTVKAQPDMCDSFCFLEWALMDAHQQTLNKKIDGTFTDINRIRGRNVSTTKEGVVCLTSEDCNWTNQPTLYTRSWFLESVAAPCLTHPSACVGKPGRMSAVRQEQFFLKFPDFWARKKYKICLSSGVFYHNEVDNRE